MGKGVCGTAASQRTTQVIKDVLELENYIACDEETRSEVVVPVFLPGPQAGAAAGAATAAGDDHDDDEPKASADSEPEWRAGERLCAVLDIDGEQVGAFTAVDAGYLQAICREFITEWAATAGPGAGAVSGYSEL